MAFYMADPIWTKIVVDGIVLEQISNFEHLGYNFSFNKSTMWITSQTGWTMCAGLLGEGKYTWNCLRWWFFLNGSENWTLTVGQAGRIQAAEMRFLRLAKYTLQDHKIQHEFHVRSILDRITQYWLSWLEHLNRMDGWCIPKQLLHYRPNRRRSEMSEKVLEQSILHICSSLCILGTGTNHPWFNPWIRRWWWWW